MWFAHYETATGRLRSQGSAKADPMPPGWDVKEYAEKPTNLWSEADRDFTLVPEPPAMSPGEFMQLFTPQERIAIRQAAKGSDEAALFVEDFLDLVRSSDFIRPGGPAVKAGLLFLQSEDLLTAERVGEISSGTQ